jgi:hypothetical protein
MNQPNVPAVAPVAVAPNPGQLVQIGTTSAPTPTAPVVSVGLNWEVIIPLVFAGLGLLLAQVLNYLQSRKTAAKVDDAAAVTAAHNATQSTKLQRIEVLVDGRYGQVLQELAAVKRLLAAESGLASDKTKAAVAQARADEQEARVAVADTVPPPAVVDAITLPPEPR